jgi:hypothetical protein
MNAQTGVRPLAAKAMLVKLTSSKPTTARREKAAEAVIQTQMGDSSLTVSSHIFKDKHNPVRKVLNEAGMVYSYHVSRTMAWQDRGPRMLPVDQYESYSAAMRKLIADVDSAVHALAPVYDGLVAQDIAERSAAATAKNVHPNVAVPPVRDFSAEYPSFEQFKEKMKFEFLFTPMPDESHFLFDMNDEDKAAFAAQLTEVEAQAKAEVIERMRQPLIHLIGKLQKQINTEGAIFRDTAVSNIVEQCEAAESLAMGDEQVLAMIAEIRKAIRPHALAPNTLRESPIVRAEAAVKLADVARKMDFLMGAPA